MNKLLLAAMLLVAVLVSACQSTTTTQVNTAEEDNVKTFTLQAENFAFYMDGKENPEIIVNQGDTVRINFVNNQGFHDWVLDEFNARTPQLQANGTATVEFVANQSGTFEYYCSVGKHREMGMKGTFMVI